jgi:hypothetical protein
MMQVVSFVHKGCKCNTWVCWELLSTVLQGSSPSGVYPAVLLLLPVLQPVAHHVGESVEKLHSRYVHALFELGKQHDVQLELDQ